MGSGTGTSEPKRKRVKPDTDLVVIVGGQSFDCYSQNLTAISLFFEKTLSVGMREQENYIVTLPDENPEEWELLMRYVLSFPTAELTQATLFPLARLCDKFGIYAGLCHLDDFCAKEIQDTSNSFRSTPSVEKLCLVVSNTELAWKTNLVASREKGFAFVLDLMRTKSYIGQLFFELQGKACLQEQLWFTIVDMFFPQEYKDQEFKPEICDFFIALFLRHHYQFNRVVDSCRKTYTNHQEQWSKRIMAESILAELAGMDLFDPNIAKREHVALDA